MIYELQESITGKIAKFWTPIDKIEPGVISQVEEVLRLEETVEICMMPDCHQGSGCSIGSVIVMDSAVGPSLVGVDIGCGMLAHKLGAKVGELKGSPAEIRKTIEEEVPVGFNWHDSPLLNERGLPLWWETKSLLPIIKDNKQIMDKALCQIGTLGGGNHFIELSVDEEDNLWLVLHSGSRNIGYQIAKEHLSIAAELDHNKDRYKALSTFRQGTNEFNSYVHDLIWAQGYAKLNRDMMRILCIGVLEEFCEIDFLHSYIQCHHNFAEGVDYHQKPGLLENSYLTVTRKGAISARKDQMGIIPGSMGTSTYIVEGLGNADSWYSASHGAGRKMSRTKAKKMFSIADLKEMTAGIECKKDKSVLDEIPGSYKDIETVMKYQSDLVKPVAKLEQLLCVKG